MVILLILLIWFHHIDTILSGVTSLVEPYFISKVTLLNEDYFCKFYAYKYSPVNYVTLILCYLFNMI